MTVWLTKPSDPEAKLSSAALISVAVLVLGLALWGMPSSGTRTASSLKALDKKPTPTSTEQVLPQPQEIEWQGYVRRVFIGGQALEIAGSNAPGGIFQVYASSQSPIVSGPVSVRGTWKGYTCAYGGDNGRCVPEVDMRSIERHTIDLR